MFNLNSPFYQSLIFFICFTENLALHKPAWQSSTLRYNTGADRAVDGQYTDLDEGAGQCAASYFQQIAEWRVDLGGVKNIHHVFLQYTTANRVWGTVSFKLHNSVLFIQMYYTYNFFSELKWLMMINIHSVLILNVTGNCMSNTESGYSFVKSNN